MKCPNCGESYTQKRNFCVVCGADLAAPAHRNTTEQAAPPPTAPPPPPPPAPAPARPLTAEDFFGTPRVQPLHGGTLRGGRDSHMNELSVDGVDCAVLQQERTGIHRSNSRYMQTATAAETDASNLMQGSAAPVDMAAANGHDDFNCTHTVRPPVVMPDSTQSGTDALPDDDPRVPSFIRARRKHTISLEVPNSGERKAKSL